MCIIAIHTILRKFVYPCATRYVDFIGLYGTPHLNDMFYVWSLSLVWHDVRFKSICRFDENIPALTCCPCMFHSRFALLTLLDVMASFCDITWHHVKSFVHTTDTSNSSVVRVPKGEISKCSETCIYYTDKHKHTDWSDAITSTADAGGTVFYLISAPF